LGTWQWYALWLTLFLNTCAGIALISQASPMAQEISRVTAARAAGLVGIVSIANGMGRLLWAWLSDLLGRRSVFVIMFVLQALAFALLSRVESFSALTILAFLVLLCYGGGFGTMPAFAADFFGPKDIGSVYGFMLTAWGAAGVCGPTLIARMREASGHYEGAFRIMAGAMLLGAVAPLLLHPPRRSEPRP
jgi:OFA family oxalate/formate antiporter-like MFS transporter